MMKKLYRMVALALAAAALCFSLTGCGISDFFKNKDNKTQDDPNASPSAASTATPEAATHVPEASATPEATKVPVKVEIFYENKAVTELSFQTSTVIRLQAVASDGSTGGIWTSSDASSASVDENGIVTCWKVGNPKITYTIGDASASLSLTVTEPTIKICYGGVEKTDISLSGQWGYEIQLTAAVTPEPQLAIIGRSKSTPWRIKISFSSSTVFSSPLITRSLQGTLSAPGICPRRKPGRGSSAWPLKRAAGRASTICADPSWLTSSTSVSRLITSGSKLTSNSPSANCGSPCSNGSSSRRQPSRPPATIDTFSTPKVRNIHQARGAENRLPSS